MDSPLTVRPPVQPRPTRRQRLAAAIVAVLCMALAPLVLTGVSTATSAQPLYLSQHESNTHPRFGKPAHVNLVVWYHTRKHGLAIDKIRVTGTKCDSAFEQDGYAIRIRKLRIFKNDNLDLKVMLANIDVTSEQNCLFVWEPLKPVRVGNTPMVLLNYKARVDKGKDPTTSLAVRLCRYPADGDC